MRLHITLCALILCGAGLMQLGQVVQARSDRAKAAAQIYTDSLSLARTRLTAKVKALTDEAAFQQNLKWGYINSVSQGLKGYLEANILDAIAIFGPGCAVIARATFGDLPPAACSDDQVPKGGGFFWREINGRAILSFEAPFAIEGAATLRIVAHLTIDHGWLINNAELRDRLAPLSLLITSRDKVGLDTILAQEGLTQSGGYIALLVSRDLLLRFIPSSWLKRPKALSNLALALILLAAALTVAAHVGAQQLEQKARAAVLDQARAELELGRKDDEIQGLKNREEQLSATVQRLETAIHSLEHEQAEHTHFKTMALQLNSSTDGFITRLAELGALADSMNFAFHQQFIVRAAALTLLIQTWMEGIAQSNARKFLRTLAERPTSGGNELSEQIAQIQELSFSLEQIGTGLAQKAETISHRSLAIKNVALFWRSLDVTTPGEERQWLIDIIIEAQGLVMTVAGNSDLEFCNKVDETILLNHLGQQKSFWVSLFYHLYSTLVPEKGARSSIVSTLAHRDQQCFLVMNWEEKGLVAPSRSKDAPRHWKLAERLVKPTTLKISVLPILGTGSHRPIALHWQAAPLAVGTTKPTRGPQPSRLAQGLGLTS